MILGIDPGLANVGWAVLRKGGREGREAELMGCGCIKTKPAESSAERLYLIDSSLGKLIDKFGVKEMAVESLFFARNVKSAMQVAEAIGVIKVCGARQKIRVFDYTPLQIKMTLVGYGQAEKRQVEVMVRNFLFCKAESVGKKKGMDQMLTGHASDAAAAGLTHLFTNRDLVIE